MQVVKMGLAVNEESGLDNMSLLQMIERELSTTSNLVVKKRAIELLKEISDFDEF